MTDTVFLFANGACTNDYFKPAERRIVLTYMNHVHMFRQTGIEAYISAFLGRGVWNRDHDTYYRFVTDPDLLRMLIRSLGE